MAVFVRLPIASAVANVVDAPHNPHASKDAIESRPAGRRHRRDCCDSSPGLACLPATAGGQQVMPDDHSEVEPLLPIPNRTVKRLSADDSEQLACESRTSSGKPRTQKRPERPSGRFCIRGRLRRFGAGRFIQCRRFVQGVPNIAA